MDTFAKPFHHLIFLLTITFLLVDSTELPNLHKILQKLSLDSHILAQYLIDLDAPGIPILFHIDSSNSIPVSEYPWELDQDGRNMVKAVGRIICLLGQQ